jgi:hypothetical protein
MKTFNIVYEPRVEDPVTIAKLETRKEAEEYMEMIKNTKPRVFPFHKVVEVN